MRHRGVLPAPGRREAASIILRASAASAAAFCFTQHYTYWLQLESLYYSTNWNEWAPRFVAPVAALVGAIVAGMVVGILIAASVVAAPYMSAALSVCLGAGIVYPLTMGKMHPVDLLGAGIGGWWLVVVAMGSAVAALGSFLRLSGRQRKGSHLGKGAVNRAARSQQSSIGFHYGVLAAVWVLGGFVIYDTAPVSLVTLGAIVFVLHTYPRLHSFPRVSTARNLPIILPALFLCLVLLRSLPYLKTTTFARNYTWFASTAWAGTDNSVLAWHLTVVRNATLSLLGALAVLAVSSALAKRSPPPQLNRALRNGGWAILLLIWPAFYGRLWQYLPLMLLLLLYTYYLTANADSLRPLLKLLTVGSSWVPIIGLWQFEQQYLVLWRSRDSPPPIWSCRLGAADPFMAPTSVGMTIAVLLPLVYGLYRTAQSTRGKRSLTVIGILLFLAMIFTFCRSAWLSTVAVVAVGSVWIGGRRYRWVPMLVLLVAASAALAHVTGVVRLDQVLQREAATNVRVEQIRLAWEVLREHPLLGIAPVEWDRRWLALGNSRTWGIGGLVAGWFQVPAESGLVGTGLLLAMAVALGVKVRRVIGSTADPDHRLLLQCAALGIISVIVSNLTECTLLQEGHQSLPILLGAILGSGKAPEPTATGQSRPPRASRTCSPTIGPTSM